MLNQPYCAHLKQSALGRPDFLKLPIQQRTDFISFVLTILLQYLDPPLYQILPVWNLLILIQLVENWLECSCELCHMDIPGCQQKTFSVIFAEPGLSSADFRFHSRGGA